MLTDFIQCLIYLSIMSLSIFYIGVFIPRNIFNPEAFPLRAFGWESGGKIYEKLYIRKWKDKVPDMSKINKRLLPKKFDFDSDSSYLLMLLYETCVAEFVHYVLIVLGFFCRLLWTGAGGNIVSIIWALGNVPFIIIQRYNRPKILKTYRKMVKFEGNGKKWIKRENVKIDV